MPRAKPRCPPASGVKPSRATTQSPPRLTQAEASSIEHGRTRPGGEDAPCIGDHRGPFPIPLRVVVNVNPRLLVGVDGCEVDSGLLASSRITRASP